MIRLRILPTESRSKVRLKSPRATKAQRTNLLQLSTNSCSRNRPQNTNRNLAVSVGMLRPLTNCARRGRIFPGPARSIDFAAQQEGLGPLAQGRRRQLEEGRRKLADFVPAESALTTSGGFQGAGEITQFSCVGTEFNRAHRQVPMSASM